MVKLADRVRYLNIESDLPEYDPYGMRKLIRNQTLLDLGGGWSPEHTLPAHILEAAKWRSTNIDIIYPSVYPS